MQLEDLQVWFQNYIAPHDEASASQNKHDYDLKNIAAIVKPSSTLESHQRLELYRSMIRLRFLRVLESDFPGVKAILGEKKFRKLAEQYLNKYPPRGFSLTFLSATFARFITEQKTLKRKTLLQQLADFEMLYVTIFAEQDTGSIKEEHPLQHRDMNDVLAATLKVNAVVRLVAANYALKDIRATAKANTVDPINTARQKHYYLVCRPGYSIVVESIDANEYAVLNAIIQGKTIGEALTVATKKMNDHDLEQLRSTIGTWFEKWSRLRLF